MPSLTQHPQNTKKYLLMIVKRTSFLFLGLLIIALGVPASPAQAKNEQIDPLAYSDNIPVPPEVNCTETPPPLSHVGTAVQQEILPGIGIVFSSQTACNNFSGDWILDVPNVSANTTPTSAQEFYTEIGNLIRNTEYIFSLSTLSFDTHEKSGAENLVQEYLAPAIRDLHNATPQGGPYPLLRFLYSDREFKYDQPTEVYNDLTARLSELESDPANWRVSIAVGVIGNLPLDPWNHSKIAVSDYRHAIVGGMNWSLDYVSLVDIDADGERMPQEGNRYIHNLHDLSLEVEGEAAKAAGVFIDKLWRRMFSPDWVVDPEDCQTSWSAPITGEDCNLDYVRDYAPNNNQIPNYSVNGGHFVFSLGRGHTDSGLSLIDYSADNAILAAFDSAQESIFISQHRLTLAGSDAFSFAPEVRDAVIDAVLRGVNVKIALSEPWGEGLLLGEITGGLAPYEVFEALQSALKSRAEDVYGAGSDSVNQALCRLELGPFRVPLYPYPEANDHLYHTHNKFFMIDEIAFYAGSQNLYPSAIGSEFWDGDTDFGGVDLNEYGYLIDDAILANQMLTEYWNPIWSHTKIEAYRSSYLPDDWVCPQDLAPSSPKRISETSGGIESNGKSTVIDISADGRFILFVSDADNLVVGDTNGFADLFVYDAQTETTTRVNVGSNGQESEAKLGQLLTEADMSSDGRFIVFSTYAQNFTVLDSNNHEDVYIHDRDSDDDGIFDEPGAISTKLVSMGLSGTAVGIAYRPKVSSDGRYVAFSSNSANLVPGEMNDRFEYHVYVRDMSNDETSILTTYQNRTLVMGWPTSISGDGRYVAYISNDLSESTYWLTRHLYVYDQTLGGAEQITHQDYSLNSPGLLSNDGRYLLFSSTDSTLVLPDDGDLDLFMKDLSAGTLESFFEVPPASGLGISGLSDDGKYVVFTSDSESSATFNAFLLSRESGVVVNLSVNENGQSGNADSSHVVISADGTVAAFSSNASNLVENDTNGVSDVFIIRVQEPPVTENQPPILVNDSSTLQEDTSVSINVLSNDSDPEGDPLVVDLITQPANGNAMLNPDNTITYAPDVNFNGGDSFTYTASDGNGGSDSATVTVTVQPVNDAPIANDDTITLVNNLGEAIAVLDNDTDIDGDNLSVTDVTQPANGVTLINTGTTITYIPNIGFTGVDSFIYTISDLNGGTDTATVTVNVTGSGSNQPPAAVITATPNSGPAPLTVNFSAAGSSDADGSIVSYAWSFGDGRTSTRLNPRIRYDTNGVYTVTLTVTDDDGATGTTSTIITVGSGPVNQPPTAVAAASITSGTAPLSVNFTGSGSSDSDGSIVSYAWVFGDGGSATTANPTHSYTAAGSYVATLTVMDDDGATDTDTITINVTNPGGGCTSNCTRVSGINMMVRSNGSVMGTVAVVNENGTAVTTGVVSATWTLPNGATSSVTAPLTALGTARFTVNDSGAGIYTLTITNLTSGIYTFDAANSVLSSSIAK